MQRLTVHEPFNNGSSAAFKYPHGLSFTSSRSVYVQQLGKYVVILVSRYKI